jgi:hypothetical protein
MGYETYEIRNTDIWYSRRPRLWNKGVKLSVQNFKIVYLAPQSFSIHWRANTLYVSGTGTKAVS